MNTLYITGAGISAESGIPTFRGKDGYWTIGSKNYTPMQMATRHMYIENPAEFLAWYYQRFAIYHDIEPNAVHYWLSDKNLITQNIDGLDAKAGNKDYIAIHGRLDQMTLFHEQGMQVDIIQTPWDKVDNIKCKTKPELLKRALFEIFNIQNTPTLNESFKPYVLLFDEFYTDLYRISEAQERISHAEKIIFMGTSFSVNITQMALDTAIRYAIPIEVVDPDPVILPYNKVTYHRMKASEYIQQ